MVSNEHEFRIGYGRMQIEARVLCGKPFEHFRIRKEKYVLDSLFVNCFQGKVKGRNDGIVTEREPHDLKAVLVKNGRFARVVAEVVDRNAFSHFIYGLHGLRIRTAAQIKGSVQIKNNNFNRTTHMDEYSIFFYF